MGGGERVLTDRKSSSFWHQSAWSLMEEGVGGYKWGITRGGGIAREGCSLTETNISFRLPLPSHKFVSQCREA